MAGIDNNTVLYLRGDSFEDLSLNPKVVTNNGVSLDNNCFKFGASKRLVINSDDVFAFGIGDFTVEMEVFLTNYSESDLFVSNNNYRDFYFNINPSGKLRFDTTVTTQYSTSTILLNTWSNVCISRKDGTVYMFINGKLQNNALNNGNITMTSPRIGYHDAYTSDKIEGNIRNIRVSNIARYVKDYVPQASYNSITINVTNQTNTNIDFNVSKLGQETINKVEVLVNSAVSKVYTDNYDSIDYLIDKELCAIGNNDITIRVTFDDIYTEELSLTHKATIDELPLETPLLDTVERVKLLTKSKQSEKDMLSSILTSKNVEVSEEDKMSDLIGKVDLLGEYDDSKLWLYKDGDNLKNISKVAKNENGNGVISVSFDNECIKIINNENSTSGATSNNALSIGINSKIDISKYTKIKCEFTSIVNNYNTGKTSIILLSSSNYTYNAWQEDYVGVFSKYRKQLGNEAKAIVECDITNINELSYISVNVVGNNSMRSASVSIHKIWLEK